MTKKTLRKTLGKKIPKIPLYCLSFSLPIIRVTHPVLSPGEFGEWDDIDVHSHWIFRDETDKYWMYYNGKRDSNSGIGLAESNDGINFVKNAKNPLLFPTSNTWENDFLWKCQVLKFGKTDFRMWYGGHLGDLGQVGYAVSNDGINWKKNSKNPVLTVGNSDEWDSKHAENLRVVYERRTSEFKGLYFGSVKKYGKSNIGLATSPDGINWTKYHNNPVLKPLPNSWEAEEISPFYLMNVDDFYILFYEGRGRFNKWFIGITYSQDLINWYRDPRNPVFRPGFPDSFDSEFVSDPCIVVEPNILRLYYGSLDFSGSTHIGLAYLPLGEKFSEYFRDTGVAWNNYIIDAGDETDGVICKGYDCEINFISDVEGTLTISVHEQNGKWLIYDVMKIPCDKMMSHSLRDVEAIRISFDRVATVTARYFLKKLKLYENILSSTKKNLLKYADQNISQKKHNLKEMKTKHKSIRELF